MYFKEIETDKEAKRCNDDSLKKNASERLKANSEYNKKNKKKLEGLDLIEGD